MTVPESTNSESPKRDFHRPHDWFALLFLPSLIAIATPISWPRWAMMWCLCAAIFIGCKWLTWHRRPAHSSSLARSIGWFIAWPGMDAATFFDPAIRAAKPSSGEWSFAAVKLLLGLFVLFYLARRLPPIDPYWLGWIGMIGIALSLHFGSFHLLSCAWRWAGIQASPLMNWPLASTKISDYWGRRWNTAFRDLTHRFLFRPLIRRLGGRGALWVGFFVSGLIHDAVVSIPASGGYGGPTLFFLVQAMGITIERTQVGKKIGLGRGIRGWIFTMMILLAPARLLFHPPFVERIIVPFMHAIGALP